MWQTRQMIALAMLAICAYTDIKEKNIYIMPLVICSAGGVALSVVSVIFTPGSGAEAVLSVFAGTVIVAAVTALGKHMGPGDGYLMAALGIVLGIRTDAAIIAAAFTLAALYSVFGLISDKIRGVRKRKSIPFAPFVMAGFMVVLINGIQTVKR